MKVAIFPGHVGKDAGAISGTDPARADNYYGIESVITNAIASKVAMFLQLCGIDYKLQAGSFELRIANTKDCQLGIDLHVDSFPSKPSKRGFHVMHYPGSKASLKLAVAIETAMNACPGAVETRGIHTRNDLRILKETAFPCILVELGFISNSTDEAMLSQDHHQYQIAFSVVQGIRAYMYATI